MGEPGDVTLGDVPRQVRLDPDALHPELGRPYPLHLDRGFTGQVRQPPVHRYTRCSVQVVHPHGGVRRIVRLSEVATDFVAGDLLQQHRVTIRTSATVSGYLPSEVTLSEH